jgi:hypothetical protein
VSPNALAIAATSLRVPGPVRCLAISSNYGSEDSWFWRRYAVDTVAGSVMFRIPPGERASAEDRARWAEQLQGQPTLLRRLVFGEPAIVSSGQAVCDGVFNPALHVSPRVLEPVAHTRLYLGWDAGLTPACVVLQVVNGQVVVYAGLCVARGGTAQLVAEQVVPWLSVHAPWALERGAEIEHDMDPSMFTPDPSTVTQSPMWAVRRVLSGMPKKGPVSWPARRDPLMQALGTLVGGQPGLIVSAGKDTEALRHALGGGWQYGRGAGGQIERELPDKNHPDSDLGDCLCYAVAAARPWRMSALRSIAGGLDGPVMWADERRGARGPLQPAIMEDRDVRVRFQYRGEGPNGLQPARLE